MQQKTIDRTLVILILINIAIALLIFVLSAQPANVSAPLSSSFTYNVIKPILTLAGADEEEILKAAFSIHGLVRKLAHFGIYFIFGITLKLMYRRLNLKHAQTATLITGFLYALSDEIHQLFVPGRSGELRDVLIDFSGVITGTLFLFIILTVLKRCKK